MNPKAAEVWNFSLAKMESARRYIEQDQDELAKTEIAKAVYVGDHSHQAFHRGFCCRRTESENAMVL
jgi:hypothetical protein